MDKKVNICHTYSESGELEDVLTIDGQCEDVYLVEDVKGKDVI